MSNRSTYSTSAADLIPPSALLYASFTTLQWSHDTTVNMPYPEVCVPHHDTQKKGGAPHTGCVVSGATDIFHRTPVITPHLCQHTLLSAVWSQHGKEGWCTACRMFCARCYRQFSWQLDHLAHLSPSGLWHWCQWVTHVLTLCNATRDRHPF